MNTVVPEIKPVPDAPQRAQLSFHLSKDLDYVATCINMLMPPGHSSIDDVKVVLQLLNRYAHSQGKDTRVITVMDVCSVHSYLLNTLSECGRFRVHVPRKVGDLAIVSETMHDPHEIERILPINIDTVQSLFVPDKLEAESVGGLGDYMRRWYIAFTTISPFNVGNEVVAAVIIAHVFFQVSGFYLFPSDFTRRH